MKKLSITIFKFLLIAIFFIGMLSFSHSLTPQRSEIQKVYDDFVKELDGNIQTVLVKEVPNSSDVSLSAHPVVTIEFLIKEGAADKTLRYELNWGEHSNLKKSFRILDLLRTANVFSLPNSAKSEDAAAVIRVIGASGYKFESYLKADELEKNSPLKLALVLMQELTS